MNTTHGSLLEELHQSSNQDAWDYFVRLYTPLMQLWARRLGLSGSDADDLVQDVFTVLVEKLPEFRYDPRRRFRAWLWTILANKARERRRRPGLVCPLDPDDLVDPASPDPASEIAESEYRDYLIRRALELIQHEFQPATWQAFWECCMTDQPATVVAAKLGMSIDAVYNAKSKVLRRLRRDLEGLLD
jgi:RNA polymerase sigma-70 factor (ECF subfamily)